MMFQILKFYKIFLLNNFNFLRMMDIKSFERKNDISIPMLINSELNENNLIKHNQNVSNQLDTNDVHKPVFFSLNPIEDSNLTSSIFPTSLQNGQTNYEMDWNDPEIFQLCQDLNEGEHFMQTNAINSNINQNELIQSNGQNQFVSDGRSIDPILNPNDVNYLSWDILEPDYNQLMNGYLQSPTI